MSKIALIIAKGLKKGKGEEDPSDPFKKLKGESAAEDISSEEEDEENPVDLFLESIGVTPTESARKAFKLAVQSCEELGYAVPGNAGRSTREGPYRGTATQFQRIYFRPGNK